MRIHLLGIGGAGMSAIARLLHARGDQVSGDDRAASPLLQALNAEGIPAWVGHLPEHLDAREGLPAVEVVAPSSAIPRDAAELVEARRRGLPVWHRGELLNALLEGRVGVAVAGTHGKSTTTGMLATALIGAGEDASFIIGATPLPLGTNARHGGGSVFVLEADEYDRTFLRLTPTVAVITSVAFDHPDIFKDLSDTQNAFALFARSAPAEGAVVACADDPGVREALRRAAPLTAPLIDYGLHAGAWRATALRPNALGGIDFAFTGPAGQAGTCSLRVPGDHNVLNALCALATGDALGVPVDRLSAGLGAYRGAERRFELLGEARGVRVIDDYAHNPAKIRAALAAARQRFPVGRIWAIWQPHTFSRTVALMDEFATAFKDADEIITLPVYAAREALADFPADANWLNAIAISRRIRHPASRPAATMADATGMLFALARGGDVVITLSAGDGNQVGKALLAALKGAGG
ncbi:MAG: UDP-N-acetylmuramate--L-alanine ligase [Thermoflexales bacterium]|nr:UDP-N-acetylmuramate--L-alanine ligase [Thermoflexales bacterium]